MLDIVGIDGLSFLPKEVTRFESSKGH